jgi:hypothetical protein
VQASRWDYTTTSRRYRFDDEEEEEEQDLYAKKRSLAATRHQYEKGERARESAPGRKLSKNGLSEHKVKQKGQENGFR